MAVVDNYENVVARSSSGEIRNAPTYQRTFTVRCDNPDTSMVDIANAPGINYGTPHPHDASCFVTNIDVDADGDSMLIYTVSYTYTRPVGDLSVTGGTPSDGGGGGGNTPPDPLKIPEGYWSGSCVLQQEMKQAGVEMTNGRAYTSGIPVDYSSPQLKMTNFYTNWDDVEKIIDSVDMLNIVGWQRKDGGCWKVVDVNWSFKEQSSEQKRLEYFEVTATLQSAKSISYDGYKHDLQNWPCQFDPTVWKAEQVNGGPGPLLKDPGGTYRGPSVDEGYSYQSWYEIPGWFPQIPSAGFQEKGPRVPCKLSDGTDHPWRTTSTLRPIMTKIVYKNCEGNEIPYEDLPKGDLPENEPCEWPEEEPTTEEQPLDWEGKRVKKEEQCEDGLQATEPCIVIPWTESSVGFAIDFEEIFGKGPPFRPKAGPLPEPTNDDDIPARDEPYRGFCP
jgi:hypothetical protein